MNTLVIPGLELDRAALDRARISRDARFDGRFYIAVLSTRIYCRPICPAPSPKPANVRYYASAAAAAEAGFRPCLRCRPEAAPASPAWLGASAVVRRALRLIDEGALDEGPVGRLADRLGIGERHLRRLFAQYVGASPVTVAQTRRLGFAKRLIDETNLPMTEVALAAGYGSVRRFNAAFSSTYRRTPSQLRQRRPRALAAGDDHRIALRLAYRPPYDWAGLMRFLAAHAVSGIEHVDRQRYARTIRLDGKPTLIVVRNLADEQPERGIGSAAAGTGLDALEFRIHGASALSLFNMVNRARHSFDLSVDPAQVNAALQRHELLAPLATQCPGRRIPGVWDDFECAVRALLGGGQASREQLLVSRLVRHCGSQLTPPLAVASLTHLFPTPRDIVGANLKPLGFDADDCRALTALASAVLEGRVDFSTAGDDLMRELRQLPGVSEEAAEYIMLRGAGEPDAFPASGDWLGRAGSEADVRELAEAWRPWRGYAAMHLWHAADAGHRAGNADNAVPAGIQRPTGTLLPQRAQRTQSRETA